MNLSPFDQSKIKNELGKNTLTPEAEAVRLSNELRSKPAHFLINSDGVRIDIPAKRGFDVETCDFITMVNWLADTRIKKSQSLIMFVHRIMAVRFPTEYSQHKNQIDNRIKLEYEMIQSNAKNDITWLGEVGFSNMVRLDGSLSNSKNIMKKQRNEEIKITRK